MGFVACQDEVGEVDTQPQTNPQEVMFDASNITAGAPATATFDLEALNNANQLVNITTASVKDLPEGYTFRPLLVIAKDDTFSPCDTIAASYDESGNISVKPDVLQGVYVEDFTRDPAAATIHCRVIPMLVNGNAEVRVGALDYYLATGTITIKPFAPANVIEDTYYLIGTASNGAVTGGIKLSHSDASPYDDPRFTTVVEITDAQALDGYTWAIVPESTVAAGAGLAYGPETASELKGALVATTAADVTYGKITSSGPYNVSVNIETHQYEFMLAIENLYTPGNSNGWNQGASQLLYTYNYEDYMGFAHLNGLFKFSTQPNWNGKNLGAGAEEGTLSDDGGAGNLNAPADALYWCKVNLPKLTYSITEITSLGAIGGFNGWGAQEAFEHGGDFLIWTGIVTLTEGTEFKIRMNDDWGINLGAKDDNYNLDELVLDGNNIKCDSNLPGFEGDGTYVITVDLSALPYYMMLEKQ